MTSKRTDDVADSETGGWRPIVESTVTKKDFKRKRSFFSGFANRVLIAVVVLLVIPFCVVALMVYFDPSHAEKRRQLLKRLEQEVKELEETRELLKSTPRPQEDQ